MPQTSIDNLIVLKAMETVTLADVTNPNPSATLAVPVGDRSVNYTLYGARGNPGTRDQGKYVILRFVQNSVAPNPAGRPLGRDWRQTIGIIRALISGPIGELDAVRDRLTEVLAIQNNTLVLSAYRGDDLTTSDMRLSITYSSQSKSVAPDDQSTRIVDALDWGVTFEAPLLEWN